MDASRKKSTLRLAIAVHACIVMLGATSARGAPFVHVTTGDPNGLFVLDPSADVFVELIPFPSRPVAIAVHPNGTMLYVTLPSLGSTSGRVAAIDTLENVIVATIPVGVRPLGIAISPDGSRIYVANSDDDTVSVIDTASNSVVATVSNVHIPYGVAVAPSGSIIYATEGQNGFAVIDGTTNLVFTTVSGHELHVTLDNSSSHRTPAVRAWFAAQPAVHFHYTPTSASWINQVEGFFGILGKQSPSQTDFPPKKALREHLHAFMRAWRKNPTPFV